LRRRRQAGSNGSSSRPAWHPRAAAEVACAFDYPDDETAWRALSAAGPFVAAIQAGGESAVRAAVEDALAPFRSATNGVRLENTSGTWSLRLARLLASRSPDVHLQMYGNRQGVFPRPTTSRGRVRTVAAMSFSTSGGATVSVISVQGLTKRFGKVTAVEDLSFDIDRGTITGFVGPNGAGKTTTLRAILGLVRPTAGTALIDGVPYARLQQPARHVGAVLEASGFHPGRTARNHLRVLAAHSGIPDRRVDEVLAEVDLAGAAHRRVGGFSLGMRQRLGLAAALLGDPAILILDEPTNGLDPAGVHWLRTFLRARVENGGTVLVSSHLLAELALSADSVVVIKAGRLVTQGTVAELTRRMGRAVRVRTPQVERLRETLTARGVVTQLDGPDQLVALEVDTETVGQAVAEAGVVVYEMSAQQPDLEDAVLALTTDERTVA
jgi:ABC-2 type transport system ATP-binding protein